MSTGSFTGNVPRKRGNYRNIHVGLKWCPQCRAYLAIGLFGLDRNRLDGRTGWCRRCRSGAEKRRRDSDLERTHAALKARYRADPDKHKSHVAVARALAKGIIRKPSVCPVCVKPRRLEAHHHMGYARENWLNVVWRCRQCHALEHKRGPAGHIAAA